MMIHRAPTLPVMLSCWALSGCGLSFFGAKVETSKTIAGPPSDVVVHVTVEDSGEPVDHLAANNFHVYENDVLLNEAEIGLRLLSREEFSLGLTVLLLDLSGAPSETELTRISRGAAHFVEKVSTTQAVTVVAFDGSERAREVGRFAKVEQSTKRPLPPLAPFLSKDTSRDLNSAMIAAIKGLAASLKGARDQATYGNVVTMVRGPDLAGRKTDKEVREAIQGSGFEFFSLSPEKVNFSTLSNIGKDERFTFDSIDTLPMRFQDLGIRVRAAWKSHYLVSYCSPGRAGIRKVNVKVKYENHAGSHRSASTKSEFDSTGFTGGCVPKLDGLSTASGNPPETDSTPSGAIATPESAYPVSGPEKRRATRTIGATPQESPRTRDLDDGNVVAPPSSGKYE